MVDILPIFDFYCCTVVVFEWYVIHETISGRISKDAALVVQPLEKVDMILLRQNLLCRTKLFFGQLKMPKAVHGVDQPELCIHISGQCLYSMICVFIDTNVVLGLIQCSQQLIDDSDISQGVMGDGGHDPLLA